MTAAVFRARCQVIGADPATAEQVRRDVAGIGRQLRDLLSRVKSPKARERALAIANSLIAAKVRQHVTVGPAPKAVLQ